jgi:predicted MFS family arabinose efflux permease
MRILLRMGGSDRTKRCVPGRAVVPSEPLVKRADIPIVLAAALVFADATIVTLALPNLLVDLHTTVYGVAAVLGVYTAALGCTALVLMGVGARAVGPRTTTVALCLFSAASIGCALAGSIGVLLVARVVQGAVGAVILAAAGIALAPPRRPGRTWALVGVLSLAVGPVLGGALTQAFSWRAIFVAQAPLPLVAAALRRTWYVRPEPAEPATPRAWRPLVVLALVSGALTALLFGVVLLLVVGWAMQPLSAAFAVSIVPVAALAGALVRGRDTTRVAIGSGLIGGGVAALAFLPTNDVAWLVVPELVAGFGMGLALTPLIEDVLPERTHVARTRNVAIRHLGVTLTLVALAPVISHDLDHAVEHAKLQTVGVVLAAPIGPGEKLSLAPKLVKSVHSDRPLAAIRSAGRGARPGVKASERSRFDEMFGRIETTFVAAARDAFQKAFLIAALLAFAAAALLVVDARAPALAAIAAGVCVAGGQALVNHFAEPQTFAVGKPCESRPLPHTGGLGGITQDVVLRAVDAAACRLGASREELVLALADKSEAERFQRKHGVDPRSIGTFLRLLTGR